MLIFRVLHILSMFTMVTVFVGGEVLVAFAIWRRDVRALATLEVSRRKAACPSWGSEPYSPALRSAF